ncbi:MAG: malto-oligosyltrehalose trehalohydrolase [Rhodospirillales bacterium]|nr:malto-oligosyltrehalose trehalohydrolase [Rhodospirillales bacterium]
MPFARSSRTFGPSLSKSGTTFRIWAPDCEAMDVCLLDRRIPMTPQQDGWHSVFVEGIGAGSRYGFARPHGKPLPDPASRFNPEDVHGLSEVIDPAAYCWRQKDWRGRPWYEAIIYELHIGAFTPEGTFSAAVKRLPYLAELGITAIELMPVADFPGQRDWGYNGTLPFAPDASYGRPEELKLLIDEAHRHKMMVFLDVVYNHFGPEGNYLHQYARSFFSRHHHTPWGDAFNFDEPPACSAVREFFIANALYWLEEYRFDGLRLDAVHAIKDELSPDILDDIAQVVADGPGSQRYVHLVLENDNNATHYLKTPGYRAQWNEDLHHALHVLVSGETDGYYADYADRPAWHLGRCLAEGFAYQGEQSSFRGGQPRGDPSNHLPPTSFIGFVQNHDQVGNRAHGDRLIVTAPHDALKAATALLLLSPSIPLLFMGEEFGAETPFYFFCNFEPDLAAKVTEGRRKEFARFARFQDKEACSLIPDPAAQETFLRSKLDWDSLEQSPHQEWLDYYKELLNIRRTEIIPRLTGMKGGLANWRLLSERAIKVEWRLGDGSRLTLQANMAPQALAGIELPKGRLLLALPDGVEGSGLPAWSVQWFLDESADHG